MVVTGDRVYPFTGHGRNWLLHFTGHGCYWRPHFTSHGCNRRPDSAGHSCNWLPYFTGHGRNWLPHSTGHGCNWRPHFTDHGHYELHANVFATIQLSHWGFTAIPALDLLELRALPEVELAVPLCEVILGLPRTLTTVLIHRDVQRMRAIFEEGAGPADGGALGPRYSPRPYSVEIVRDPLGGGDGGLGGAASQDAAVAAELQTAAGRAGGTHGAGSTRSPVDSVAPGGSLRSLGAHRPRRQADIPQSGFQVFHGQIQILPDLLPVLADPAVRADPAGQLLLILARVGLIQILQGPAEGLVHLPDRLLKSSHLPFQF